MRVVIVGQQAFGKAVLEAFLGRGDTIAGVFAAPEKPGARPDPLVAAAEERKFPVYRFPKYSAPEALEALNDHATPISASWPMCCCSRRRNSARSRSTA